VQFDGLVENISILIQRQRCLGKCFSTCRNVEIAVKIENNYLNLFVLDHCSVFCGSRTALEVSQAQEDGCSPYPHCTELPDKCQSHGP